MISSEVQRTLVKSPPELWAELSDPDTLARHLGELGEIRITRAEPEKRVDWEADGTSGTVLIKPSGWGTKVTLRVTREIEAPVQEGVVEIAAVADAEPGAESPRESELVAAAQPPVEAAWEPHASQEAPDPFYRPEPAFAEDFPSSAEFELELELEETIAAETERREAQAAPMPRRGFFARLFGRRQPGVEETAPAHPEPAGPESSSEVHLEQPVDEFPEQPAEKSPDPEPERTGSAIESLQARFHVEVASEAVAASREEPAPLMPPLHAEHEAPVAQEPEPPETVTVDGNAEAPQVDAQEAPVDIAAELRAAEEVAAEEVTAVLTAVLDRLGAAHHRPFSRA